MITTHVMPRGKRLPTKEKSTNLLFVRVVVGIWSAAAAAPSSPPVAGATDNISIVGVSVSVIWIG
jgi:hypothetical protein